MDAHSHLPRFDTTIMMRGLGDVQHRPPGTTALLPLEGFDDLRFMAAAAPAARQDF